MKKDLLPKVLPVFLFISLGVCGWIVARSLTGTRYALIANTWNDFKEAKDTDAFPAQALQAYYILKGVGYQDGRVCLMVYHSNDSYIDANLDGVNDLNDAFIDFDNDLVSKENLKHALENLSRQVRQCDEVTIYLVGHGNVTDGGLVALSFENHEFVTQAEFSGWLDDIRCEQMSVFLDFCYSGDFGKSVATPGRTAVCSSEDKKESWYYWNWTNLNPTERSIFGESGSAFFHPFWKKLGEGATLQEAFDYAKIQCGNWGFIDPNSSSITQSQNPQMYVGKRNMLDEFVFFYPGGPVGLLVVVAVALIVELILLLHSPKKQQSSASHRHGMTQTSKKMYTRSSTCWQRTRTPPGPETSVSDSPASRMVSRVQCVLRRPFGYSAGGEQAVSTSRSPQNEEARGHHTLSPLGDWPVATSAT